MKIDLAPILNGEVKELPFSFSENVSEGSADIYFKGLDAEPAGSIRISGRVYDLSGFYRLECRVSMPFATHCARCGKAFGYVCECDMQRIVSGDGEHDGNEEYIIYSDRQIELDGPVYEELSISFPSKPLCRQDCKGLCPVCGQDLNEGDCEHSRNEQDKDTL